MKLLKIKAEPTEQDITTKYQVKNIHFVICGLLGNYTASCGNYGNYVVKMESSPMKMGPTRCPETSVNNYHTKPCNYPKDHRFHQHRGGNLKSKYKF
jgi:hypothetical protein